MNATRQEIDELVAATLDGNTEAYSSLVVLYQDRLYNSLLRQCGSSALAEEYAQEAFLKAFRHLHSFRRDACFYTWLYRIAMNVAASDYRGRRKALSLNQWQENLGGEMPDPCDTPAQSLDRQEDILRVQAAIASLEPAHRSVIVLREIEGMDYQTIGSVLGIKVGTVRSRLFRAREILSGMLRPPPTCQEAAS